MLSREAFSLVDYCVLIKSATQAGMNRKMHFCDCLLCAVS
jgi:hypothetical protein